MKITDFGLARMTDDVQLTQNGVLAGTPEYMAPEQARGEPVDHRADLFSLGSVLYAMGTGISPFRGPTTFALIRQVSEETPAPMRSLNPAVPEWLEALVARLMAKNPAERFSSAADVAILLEECLAHSRTPQVAAPELLPARTIDDVVQPEPRPLHGRVRRLPRLLVWTAGAIAALLSLGIAFWLAGGGAGTTSLATPYAHEYRASLKGESGNEQDFKRSGPEADRCVHFEPEGLRIILPRGSSGAREYTGVRLYRHVRGDFEITVKYDILGEPTPLEAGQDESRITLWLRLAREGLAVGTISRRVQALGGTQHVAWLTTPDGTSGKNQERGKGFSTTAKSGWLRLSRTGSVLSYWVAEGSAEAFTLLQEYPFGAEDVDYIQIAAATGNDASWFDVRVTDLTIRTDPQPPLATAPPARPRRWLAAVISIALVAVFGSLAVLWRHRRSADHCQRS